MTVYLHIGLPKTGTTSLQVRLRDAKAGGPIYAHDSEEKFIQSRFLTKAIKKWDGSSNSRPEAYEDLVRQSKKSSIMAQLPSPMFDVVISDEVLSATRFIRDVNKTAGFLSEFDVKIIIVIRDSVEWITSLCLQDLKKREDPKTFSFDYILESRSLLGYPIDPSIIVSTYRSIFPDPKIFCYSTFIVEEILEYLGIRSDERGRSPSRFNQSPPLQALSEKLAQAVAASGQLSEEEFKQAIQHGEVGVLSEDWICRYLRLLKKPIFEQTNPNATGHSLERWQGRDAAHFPWYLSDLLK